MSIDLCNIKFWTTEDGAARYLPNNYSNDLDFTKYESVTITSLDTDCLAKKSADDKLKGVSSITANHLRILSQTYTSSINATDLFLAGGVEAQGENSTNIDINITSNTGSITVLGGGVYAFRNSKITGVGSMNTPTNSYYSSLKSCYTQAYSSNPPNEEKLSLCIGSIQGQPTGGRISANNATIGLGIEANAGIVNLVQSINDGNINSFCFLTNESTNYGKMTDVSILLNESLNNGIINGPLAIFGGGLNRGLSFAGKSVFEGGENSLMGLVIGESVFLGGANKGICSGNSFLYGGGSNEGRIIGNVVISGGTNKGFISGNVTLNDGRILNTSSIIGSVTANFTKEIAGVIFGSLVATSSIINFTYISGNTILNHCPFVSTIIGPTNINATDSTLQQVDVSGESCSFTRSSVGGGLLEMSSVNFIGASGNIQTNGAEIRGQQSSFVFSSNLAVISGDASFANCSFNYGRITGNASFDNTSYNFGTVDGECSGPGCLPGDTYDESLCA